MIIVSTPEKPFTYTPKNTPRRQAIINEYEDEINATYEAVEDSTQPELSAPSNWDAKSTLEFMRDVIQRVMDVPLEDEDDVFLHGCDRYAIILFLTPNCLTYEMMCSLQATWIRNSIVHALRMTTKVNVRKLPNNLVYQHPTIGSLASFICRLVNGGLQQQGADGDNHSVKAMLDMVAKYSQHFPVHRPRCLQQPTEKVYAITGTTGGLGCALLAHLSNLPELKAIYAINRTGKQALVDRQRMELSRRGYDAQKIMDSGKVVLVEAAIEDEHLGLPDDLYEEVSEFGT